MLDVNFERRVGEFRLNPVFSAANELAILFGPSGCGKSLTLRAVAGLLRPDSGRIELPGGVVAFDSASETDLPAQQRGTGYVVQELALFPHMSALENIEFGIASWPAQRRRERSAHLISLLGLQGLEHRRPRQMSGGQQQRVAIARALAAEPTLLLLDEPFSALDAALRHTLRREVAALRRRLDVTALFVTHDLTEAYALGDSIVVYDAGAVLQQGPMPEVFRHPASARVAELLETRNLVPGRVEAYVEGVAVVRTPWFTVRVRDPQAPIRGDVFVCIRPEHIIVERAGHASRDQNAVVDTEIVEEMSLGNTHRLFMRTTAIESDLGERYVFEVDVPAHPYEVLNIASRREWRIALANEHVSLVAR